MQCGTVIGCLLWAMLGESSHILVNATREFFRLHIVIGTGTDAGIGAGTDTDCMMVPHVDRCAVHQSRCARIRYRYRVGTEVGFERYYGKFRLHIGVGTGTGNGLSTGTDIGIGAGTEIDGMAGFGYIRFAYPIRYRYRMRTCI